MGIPAMTKISPINNNISKNMKSVAKKHKNKHNTPHTRSEITNTVPKNDINAFILFEI